MDEGVTVFKCQKCGWWVIPDILESDCDYHQSYGMNYKDKLREVSKEEVEK